MMKHSLQAYLLLSIPKLLNSLLSVIQPQLMCQNSLHRNPFLLLVLHPCSVVKYDSQEVDQQSCH